MARSTAIVVPYGFPTWNAKPPCQWGSCGHCDAGRHDRCGQVAYPSRNPRQSPHTWILDKAGRVTVPHVAVYVAGTREHWICACHVAGHGRQGEALTLFEAAYPGRVAEESGWLL